MLTHVDLTSEDRSTAVELRARQEGVVYTAELLFVGRPPVRSAC